MKFCHCSNMLRINFFLSLLFLFCSLTIPVFVCLSLCSSLSHSIYFRLSINHLSHCLSLSFSVSVYMALICYSLRSFYLPPSPSLRLPPSPSLTLAYVYYSLRSFYLLMQTVQDGTDVVQVSNQTVDSLSRLSRLLRLGQGQETKRGEVARLQPFLVVQVPRALSIPWTDKKYFIKLLN